MMSEEVARESMPPPGVIISCLKIQIYDKAGNFSRNSNFANFLPFWIFFLIIYTSLNCC